MMGGKLLQLEYLQTFNLSFFGGEEGKNWNLPKVSVY